MCKQLAFHPDEAIELLKAIGIEESKWMNHSDLDLTETDGKYDFITATDDTRVLEEPNPPRIETEPSTALKICQIKKQKPLTIYRNQYYASTHTKRRAYDDPAGDLQPNKSGSRL